MSLVLTHSASLPVIKLGRIAGQFSKPRSSPYEKKDNIKLPSYLGDNINGMEFLKAQEFQMLKDYLELTLNLHQL